MSTVNTLFSTKKIHFLERTRMHFSFHRFSLCGFERLEKYLPNVLQIIFVQAIFHPNEMYLEKHNIHTNDTGDKTMAHWSD